MWRSKEKFKNPVRQSGGPTKVMEDTNDGREAQANAPPSLVHQMISASVTSARLDKLCHLMRVEV